MNLSTAADRVDGLLAAAGHRAGHGQHLSAALRQRLSLAAAGCTLLLPLAAGSGTWLVWAGAIGVGATATAANAVSMLAVVRRGGATGHASALVALGFFGGFVIGPTTSGLLADHTGWVTVWLAVAVAFTGAAAAGALLPQPKRAGVPR